MRAWFRSISARAGLLSLLLASPFASTARADIKLDLFPGFDGSVRAETWNPLTVRLTGSGVDASGKLQLLVRTRMQGTRAYVLPLRLHAGMLNEQHTLYYIHPDLGDVNDMVVQLQAQGRVLAEKKLDNALSIQEGQPAVVGLTQDQSGLNFLAGLETGYEHRRVTFYQNNPWNNQAPGWANNPNRGSKNPTRVLYPRPFTLPDSAYGYAAVDAVALGDLSLDTMTDAQWDALVGWVQNGGILVVSGGADINRVRSEQIAALLPISATGVRQARALPSLVYRYGSAPRLVSTPLIAGTLKPDAMALCRENGTPVIAVRHHGTGLVVFTAFDLFAPELRAWRGQQRLWQEIMHLGTGELRVGNIVRAANTPSYQPWGMQYYGSSGLQDALAGVQSTDAPSFTYIGLFLLLYIVLLVPVNYFLLRRLDRKELAWLTAPVIILAFSTGAYAVGYNIKGGQLFLRYCAVVEGAANSDAWSAYTVATIFSPRQARYDLGVADPGATATEVTADTSGYQRSSNDIEVQWGGRTTVRGALVNMWDHRSFDFESRVPLEGGISASVTPATIGLLRVKVTNNTHIPLEDCSIVSGGMVSPIGALAPGQSAAQTVTRMSAGGTISNLPLPMQGSPGADPTVFRIKQALCTTISSAQIAQSGQAAPLLLTGWFAQPVGGLALQNEQPKVQGISLLVVHLNAGATSSPSPTAWTPPPANPDPFAGRGPVGGMGPPMMGAPPAANAYSYNNLAYTRANSGDLKGALSAAKQALKLAPNDGNIMDTVAEMHQRRKEYKQAAHFYVLALQRQGPGGDVETHEKYGETLLALGRKKEGIQHLRTAAVDQNGTWGQRARSKLSALGVSP